MTIYANPTDPTVARYAPMLVALAADFDGVLVARHTPPSGPCSPGPFDPEATVTVEAPSAFFANGLPDPDLDADDGWQVMVGDPESLVAWTGDATLAGEWQVAADAGDLSWPHTVTNVTDAATAGRVAASLARTLAGAR